LKNKRLIVTTIIFFLIVNLSYFWEGKLGILAFPIFIFLVVSFLVLVIICVIQIANGIKEKFSNQNRNWKIGVMVVGLGVIFLKPNGIVNFDKLEGENLLIAQREGAGNCMTTFKIKSNNKFKERSVCFGVSEVRGNYEIRNDTIFFSDVSIPIGEEYYEFAILQKSKYGDEDAFFRYRNSMDSIGNELWITKNELIK
tara:strand:- start:763 stop:1356 length:594 start_codon:yes stop_codon:yes gene_type:complete